MKKNMLFVISLICLLALPAAGAAPSEQNGNPGITAFTTTVDQVSREALASRAARIPVSWSTANRPVVANLVFEQMLPDGSAVNVELPRVMPWVNSSGSGVTAPILPDENATEIELRLRLFNIVTGEAYDESTITLPIGESGGDVGEDNMPAIASFTTSATNITPEQLEAGNALVPVSWSVANRPVTTTLVFEQVLADGSDVNVELPRENPWVNASGEGVVKPVDPGVGSEAVRLRLRLIDLVYGRVYDQRMITVPVGEAPDAAIESFTTEADSVNANLLAQRLEMVPVTWEVSNRPANANLVFEQVMPNGAVQNVELPRSVLIVPSSGTGVVMPYDAGDADTIVLQLRVADMSTDDTYASAEITLPVEEGTGAAITAFSSTAVSVSAGELASRTALVPVKWLASNRPANTNLVFEQVLADGTVENVELPRNDPVVPSSGEGVVRPYAPGGDADQITLQARLIDAAGTEYAKRQITLPLETTEPTGRITTFTTSADAVDADELMAGTARVPVTWAVSNRQGNTNLVFEQVMPNGSTFNVELPRENPWVSSTGSGLVAPASPGVGVNSIVLQLRLVNLSNRNTLDSVELRVNISGQVTDENMVVVDAADCYDDPFLASHGIQVGGRATATESVDVIADFESGEIAGRLSTGETVAVTDGPYCYRYTSGDQQTHFRYWEVDSEDQVLVGWVREYSTGQFDVAYHLQPIEDSSGDGTVEILSLAADKAVAMSGEEVLLTWETTGAASVTVRAALTGPDAADVLVEGLPATGSTTITIPAGVGSDVPGTVYLEAYAQADGDTPDATETLELRVSCDNAFFFGESTDCVVEPPQEDVEAAYQMFENGFMVWKGDTRTVYALYDDGTGTTAVEAWDGQTAITWDEDPPDGMLLPESGFGWVWTEDEAVRTALGWATAAEEGYMMTFQEGAVPATDPLQSVVYFTLSDGRTIRYEAGTWSAVP